MATDPRPVVLNARAIAELAEVPLGSLDGVMHRVLWTDGESASGVLTVAAGHRLGAHAHHANHHHMWVVSGRVEILGRELGPGGYVHIPVGVTHDIDATDTEGCTVFYLYQR